MNEGWYELTIKKATPRIEMLESVGAGEDFKSLDEIHPTSPSGSNASPIFSLEDVIVETSIFWLHRLLSQSM